jgi:phosphate:Na+ symporter
MVGGLCMFLFGMKVMSDGLQKSAGDRMRKALNFMTGNRFAGIITGFLVTAIVQSSSAVSVIVVSFVSAGLLTLIQSIGVIFGLNIGTTLTAWIISFIGFKFKLDSLALPAIGIGFILSIIKWKYKSVGDFLVGFGFLFLGLDFLASGMDGAEKIINFENFSAIRGYSAIWIGFGIGLVFTILINSSTAAIAIIMTMTFSQMISYEMAAGMVMGANLGTTTDAPLASIAGNRESKRTALVHVLFNVIGVTWACILMKPLLGLVDLVMPGNPNVPELTEQGYKYVAATTHLAGLHTIFNIINVLLFLPFVKQFAKLVTLIVPDKKQEGHDEHYKFAYLSSVVADSPELNILRVEKEIRDMAGIVSSMYFHFNTFLRNLNQAEDKEKAAEELCEKLKKKEDYADEMRDALTNFLIECMRERLTPVSERRVSSLLKAVGYLEEMSDDCYIISLLLEKNVKKGRIIKHERVEELIPYLNQVEEFLNLLQDQLGQQQTIRSAIHTKRLESDINKYQKDLQRLSRKRIEAGKDVKTELFFIDLVRRIEKLGDYCYDISNTLVKKDGTQ